MKTNELIKLLQKVDPEGSLEVCIDGTNLPSAAIISVINIPAYHDGPINIVEKNETGYIAKGHYINKGRKIVLYVATISNLIDHQILSKDKIDYSGAGGSRNYLEKYHSSLEEENDRIQYSIVKEHLQKWIKNSIGLEGLCTGEIHWLDGEAEEFLKRNPKYIKGNNEYRQNLWDKELIFDSTLGSIRIKDEEDIKPC